MMVHCEHFLMSCTLLKGPCQKDSVKKKTVLVYMYLYIRIIAQGLDLVFRSIRQGDEGEYVCVQESRHQVLFSFLSRTWVLSGTWVLFSTSVLSGRLFLLWAGIRFFLLSCTWLLFVTWVVK